jgi:putative ABC transport system substrate-binding protein
MKRREFIAGIGAASAWPLAARAQQPAGRVYRIGYQSIAPREPTLHLIKAFEDGLRSLGYRVGDNVAIEYRFADGEMERLPALAADLVRLGVDIIVATGLNPSAVAAMKATTTIPIVMTNSVDPVGTGLVASLARPGGNVTGLAGDAGGEILGKRFELLKETLPNLSRLGILWNPDVAFIRNRQTLMTEIARTLGLTTIPVEARGVDTLEQAFAALVRERAQAFVMQGDSVLFNYRGQIAEMSLRNRLPAAAPPEGVCGCGFPSDLRGRCSRSLSSVSRLCRQDTQGCEACRPAGRTTDQVRTGNQFEDRKGACRRSADIAAATRRRGDRIERYLLQCMSLFMALSGHAGLSA